MSIRSLTTLMTKQRGVRGAISIFTVWRSPLTYLFVYRIIFDRNLCHIIFNSSLNCLIIPCMVPWSNYQEVVFNRSWEDHDKPFLFSVVFFFRTWLRFKIPKYCFSFMKMNLLFMLPVPTRWTFGSRDCLSGLYHDCTLVDWRLSGVHCINPRFSRWKFLLRTWPPLDPWAPVLNCLVPDHVVWAGF